MKNLNVFDTTTEYNNWLIECDDFPNVSYVKDENIIKLNQDSEPFWIRFNSDGSFNRHSTNNQGKTIYYSLDAKTWNSFTTQNLTSLEPEQRKGPSFSTGEKIYFKHTTMDHALLYDVLNSYDGTFDIGGNLLSLHYESRYRAHDTLKYTLKGLFSYLNVVNAKDLILPDKLIDGCYEEMFAYCSQLETAPVLSAITLKETCYKRMFYKCSSLIEAPKLPATTLATRCYEEMFSECTSLTNAPELPATSIANFCYSNMFYKCTSLINAPELPIVEEMPSGCYEAMFAECTSLINPPSMLCIKDSVSATGSSCVRMFEKCSSIVKAPTICFLLTEQNAGKIFAGCSKLNYVKVYGMTKCQLSSNCAITGVESIGTIVFYGNEDVPSCGNTTYPCSWNVEILSQ